MPNTFADFNTRAIPLDELELYELMTAAFPEKFSSNEQDDNWDEVMAFTDDLVTAMDVEQLCDLLGRIVLLTLPMKTALLGCDVHALGTLEYTADGSIVMAAGVQRPALEVFHAKQ